MPSSHILKEINDHEIILGVDHLFDFARKAFFMIVAIVLYLWLAFGRVKDITEQIFEKGESFSEKI